MCNQSMDIILIADLLLFCLTFSSDFFKLSMTCLKVFSTVLTAPRHIVRSPLMKSIITSGERWDCCRKWSRTEVILVNSWIGFRLKVDRMNSFLDSPSFGFIICCKLTVHKLRMSIDSIMCKFTSPIWCEYVFNNFYIFKVKSEIQDFWIWISRGKSDEFENWKKTTQPKLPSYVSLRFLKLQRSNKYMNAPSRSPSHTLFLLPLTYQRPDDFPTILPITTSKNQFNNIQNSDLTLCHVTKSAI